MNKNRFIRVRAIESPDELNQMLGFLKKGMGLKHIYLNQSPYASVQDAMRFNSLSDTFFILEKDTKIEVTTKWWRNDGNPVPKPTTWVFSMNEEIAHIVTGRKAYAEFNRAFNIPPLEDIVDKGIYSCFGFDNELEKFTNSASPILDYNPKYQGINIDTVYCYDLNSAYANVLLHRVLDFSSYRVNSIVEQDEIGFMIDDHLSLRHKGEQANLIFKMRPPNKAEKHYLVRWFDHKLHSSGVEKQKAKDMLNLPIGYAQRKNPIFRSFVVNICNEHILSKVDENTIMFNTDAVYSTVERKDLKTGEIIGQFKLEIMHNLKAVGNNYQFGDDLPTYRGTPKAWFKAFEHETGRKWNILEDMVPVRANKYRFSIEDLKVYKEKWYEEYEQEASRDTEQES